jgi:acetyl/propionyl-CoA carboxylase alpha subunit
MTPTDAGGNDVTYGELRAPTRQEVVAKLLTIGETRRKALDDASAALDDLVGIVTAALENGADLNLTECARAAGVTKQTLYDRIPPALIDGRRTHTRSMADAPPEALS